MESKTRLAPKSNKVNSHKLTLNWNTSLYYRVVWKWRQSAFHANNHAIGGGSNGIIIHLCLNPGFGLQLLSINFVGFGSQHGLRFHTSRQSFEPSYTQIQALLVFFLSFALASQPGEICWLPTKRVGGGNPRTFITHSLAMSREAKTRFLGVSWETVLRTSSGKFLRVGSCYPESFAFLRLWATHLSRKL